MTSQDALAGLQAELDQWWARHDQPQVLDAGCGSQMHVRLGEDAYILGLDIDTEQLKRNERIHERMVGDVQTCGLLRDFDLIMCWDVLEHVRDPRLTLENLAGALRPDGLLVVGSPNVLSLKGLVTKATPFWLHRALYRQISTLRPFRTYLRFCMAPSRIRAWASHASLATQYVAFYESPLQINLRHRVKLTGKAWSGLTAIVSFFSLGMIGIEATDFVLVLRRS